MLYRVREKSHIDTTIFWGDTRVITTVEDEDGISAAGTKAEQTVGDVVLATGQDYFSDKVGVNGTKYIGYYKALKMMTTLLWGWSLPAKGEVPCIIRFYGSCHGFGIFCRGSFCGSSVYP